METIILNLITLLLTGLISLFMLYLNSRLFALKEQILDLSGKIDKLEKEYDAIKEKSIDKIEEIKKEMSEMKEEILLRIMEQNKIITQQLAYCEVVQKLKNK